VLNGHAALAWKLERIAVENHNLQMHAVGGILIKLTADAHAAVTLAVDVDRVDRHQRPGLGRRNVERGRGAAVS